MKTWPIRLRAKRSSSSRQTATSPFFLFFSTHDIHVPRVPHARFAGSTSLGPRGDVIQELDWSVGQILETLDRLKLAENTLVMFSSDNGPVLNDGYADDAVERLGAHKPAGPLRGGKYSIYEGGTRVPFLARWPACIKPAVSPVLVSQLDLITSLSALDRPKTAHRRRRSTVRTSSQLYLASLRKAARP